MAIRQTRVFVRADEPPNDWAETLVGRIFQPLVDKFPDDLEWFWFSRYADMASGDIKNCNFDQMPEYYKRIHKDKEIFHRSMRFRFNIADKKQTSFEKHMEKKIRKWGYYGCEIGNYDHVADLGSNRFLGIEKRSPGRAKKRAMLVAHLYCTISRLVIDALVGPDNKGRFKMESNDVTSENPRGSSFQSLHHLFCNITNVPTDVHVFREKSTSLLGFGTYRCPPHPSPPGGWDELIGKFPIRY